MQAGLARSKAGITCPSQQAAIQPRPQHGSRLRSPADAGGKALLRVVPKAAKVEDVGLDSSLSNGASGASNPLAFDELTDIIRMVHDTDIVELELRSKRFSLAVRKKEAIEVPEPTVVYQQAPQQQGPQYAPQASYAAPPPMGGPPAPAAGPTPAAPSSNGPAPPAVVDGIEVASPMAGTVYRSPAPGEPPFVKEGDKVTKGQTICIIEAMKLMNEIEAETTGTLVKFLADQGASVVPGQAIALIKP